MKQSLVFWIFTLIFILSCIIVILATHITNRSDDIYIREITSYSENAVSIQDIGIETSDSISSLGETKLNINTASVNELTALPGIGETIAKRIVEYREENGNFLSIEEIMEVSGIGEAKFEAIKGLIEV